jgi:signal transduction histidine kinase
VELGLLSEADNQRQLSVASRLAKGEPVGPYTLKVNSHDGRTVWLEAFPVPLKQNDDVYAIQVITRDITKRRLAEEKIRLRNEELTVLNDIAAAVSQSLNLQDVLNAVLEEIVVVLNADGGLIYLLDKDQQTFIPTIHRGLSPGVLQEVGGFKLGEGLSGRAAQAGRPLFVPDLTQDSRNISPTAVKDGLQSLVSVPLEARGKVCGVITIVSQHKEHFAPERLSMLTAIGSQTGVAIENARLFEEVRAGGERLQALSRRLVEVQENERRYVARELHDEIGQALTGLKLLLDIATSAPGESAKSNLREALKSVNELLQQVRDLSLDLRPSMLDDLGLLPALLWHCGRYTTQTNVRVDLRHASLEERRFRPEVETAAYRIVQEALTNVARHAGVNEVTVRLWIERDTLIVQIEDQGSGFDPQDPAIADVGSGLNGMRERVALLGGKLMIDSKPGAGARLTAELPLGE